MVKANAKRTGYWRLTNEMDKAWVSRQVCEGDCEGDRFLCVFRLRAFLFGEMWTLYSVSGLQANAWHSRDRNHNG